jgi:hypothetical protein
MERFKYSELLNSLRDFDTWLNELGVSVRRNDRIHRAFEIVKFAEEATRLGCESGSYDKQIQGTHLFPMIEALEAHEILQAFRDDTSDEVRLALKRALSGPMQPINETTSNSEGRNIWFELAIAASWKLRGAVVRLGEPDLELFCGDSKILIACKRPAAEHSVRSNIRGAVTQLNRTLNCAPPNVFGGIAISLSRILNPGDKYWSGNLEQLGDLLHRKLITYAQHWKSVDADPRVCSILFHAATPGDRDEGVDLTHVSFSVAGPLKHVSEGTKLFEDHMRAMKVLS